LVDTVETPYPDLLHALPLGSWEEQSVWASLEEWTETGEHGPGWRYDVTVLPRSGEPVRIPLDGVAVPVPEPAELRLLPAPGALLLVRTNQAEIPEPSESSPDSGGSPVQIVGLACTSGPPCADRDRHPRYSLGFRIRGSPSTWARATAQTSRRDERNRQHSRHADSPPKWSLKSGRNKGPQG